MKRFFPLLIFLFPFLPTEACDCKSLPLSLDAIKSDELIFIGDVIAISGCDKTAKATFEVKELFRGKCFKNTIVEFDCSSDCQMSFAPGQTWIIYSKYKKYGEVEVNFCGFSRMKMKNANEDYNTIVHGMSFEDEVIWLKKNLGDKEINSKDFAQEQHHENIHPNGMQTLYYLFAGFLGLVVFYLLGRKFLK
ncbi:hypothetical protein BH09BAC5_BH09BAC5_20830 [soil metagenome]